MLTCNTVLVADRVRGYEGADLFSRSFEMLPDEYFYAVYDALAAVSPGVTHYETPEQLLHNCNLHQNDIVLSLWSGERSRNRRSLVPAICEAAGIAYVGADAYLHALGADKQLTKALCEPYGIYGAKGTLVAGPQDYAKMRGLSFPLVIKPNCEGGSIGIFAGSLVHTWAQAVELCDTLLAEFEPLVAEEYLEGYEVSVCIGGGRSIDVFEAVQTIIGGKEYFDCDILSAETKKMTAGVNRKRVNNSLLSEDECERLRALYTALGKVDYMRIDGRVGPGGFRLLELTPDCSLRKHSSLHLAYEANGYSYEEMVEMLCSSALQWQHTNLTALPCPANTPA